MSTNELPSFWSTAGKGLVYGASAVGGLTATRFVADLAARGPIPLGATLAGAYGATAFLASRREQPWVGAFLIGSAIAVLDQVLVHLLPVAGFGPPPGSGFGAPSLFRPWAGQDDINFWRGRWVSCSTPDGQSEKKWCPDSRTGIACCGDATFLASQVAWPEYGSRSRATKT